MAQGSVPHGESRIGRWAAVARQMTADVDSRDLLVYGAGAEELARALGMPVRSAGQGSEAPPADIVLCDGPLFAVSEPEVEPALDEIARLTRETALLIFPVAGIGQPSADAPARRPLSSWEALLAPRFDVLHARDLGDGEGLALVVPRVNPFEQIARQIETVQAIEIAPALPPAPTTVHFEDSQDVSIPADPALDASIPAPVTVSFDDGCAEESTDEAALGSEPLVSPTRSGTRRGADSIPAPVTVSFDDGFPAACPEADVRVFIGSEPRSWIAETVLRHTIASGTIKPLSVVALDHGPAASTPGCRDGVPEGRIALCADTGEGAWLSDLSGVCWAIPELCGFEGRAIYVDTDTLVLGDLGKMLELPMHGAALVPACGGTSVMLLDCAAFRDIEGWPSIDEMRDSRFAALRCEDLLHRAGAIESLPPAWYSADGAGYRPGVTKIVHFARPHTRPWRPYPERISYAPHPLADLERLWFRWARSAREAGCFGDPPPPSRGTTAIEDTSRARSERQLVASG